MPLPILILIDDRKVRHVRGSTGNMSVRYGYKGNPGRWGAWWILPTGEWV